MSEIKSEGEHHLATGLAAIEDLTTAQDQARTLAARGRLIHELEELALHRDYIEWICDALVEVGPWTEIDGDGTEGSIISDHIHSLGSYLKQAVRLLLNQHALHPDPETTAFLAELLDPDAAWTLFDDPDHLRRVTAPEPVQPTVRGLEERLVALEQDSHPLKPTLDPDSFDRWKDSIERRIAVVERRCTENDRIIREARRSGRLH